MQIIAGCVVDSSFAFWNFLKFFSKYFQTVVGWICGCEAPTVLLMLASQSAPCRFASLPHPSSQTPRRTRHHAGEGYSSVGRRSRTRRPGSSRRNTGLSLIPADGRKRRKGFCMGLLKVWASQTFWALHHDHKTKRVGSRGSIYLASKETLLLPSRDSWSTQEHQTKSGIQGHILLVLWT